MNRRSVAAWCLFDFGNSAFAVLFPFLYGSYYAKTVVGGTEGSFWLGAMVSASMLCVAVSAPFLGGIADHAGIRKRLLGLYTATAIAAVLCFAHVSPGMVLAGFAVGVVANFAFEGGIVFYNAYLPEIAPATHHGRISGAGFAVGYVGSLVAIGFALLLRNWAWIWLALALQWALFALPLFLILPRDRPSGTGVGGAAREGFRNTVRIWKEVLAMPDLRTFLLAYFFYMDGVDTVIFFAGPYATQKLGFGDVELLGLLALIQVTALVGSLAMARATDVRGPKWVVRIMLVWWIAVCAATWLVDDSRPLFWAVAVLAGLGLGCIQASSRAFMSRLIPKGREAELFGFYALCGRTGAVIGPFVFGSISRALGDQRYAVPTVGLFFLAGLLLLRKVRAG
jgi:UMF1 family MFS transporter